MKRLGLFLLAMALLLAVWFNFGIANLMTIHGSNADGAAGFSDAFEDSWVFGKMNWEAPNAWHGDIVDVEDADNVEGVVEVLPDGRSGEKWISRFEPADGWHHVNPTVDLQTLELSESTASYTFDADD